MLLSVISYTPLVSIGIGPLEISPHGLFTGIGVLVGGWFLLRDVREAGYDEAVVTTVLIRSVMAALVGARVAYVVNHLSNFDTPLEVLRIWEGGASLLGGLTAAVIVAVLQLRRFKMPVLTVLDLAAPWFTLGISVGRIGDLIIGDHLGDTTGMPFGYRCPSIAKVGETVGSPCVPGEIVHLTAGYDLIVAALITLVVLFVRKRTSTTGVAIGTVGFLYGMDRFVLDIFRSDAVRFGLTGSQWTGVVLMAVSLVLLVTRRRPQPVDDDVDAPVDVNA